MKAISVNLILCIFSCISLYSQENNCCNDIPFSITNKKKIEETFCNYSIDSVYVAMNTYNGIRNSSREKFPFLDCLFECHYNFNKKEHSESKIFLLASKRLYGKYIEYPNINKRREFRKKIANVTIEGYKPSWSEYKLFIDRTLCIKSMLVHAEERIEIDGGDEPPEPPRETDSDNDGVIDKNDNCKFQSNESQKDSDNDKVGDKCDNCVHFPNPDQVDKNKNGVGDACEVEDQVSNEPFLAIKYKIDKYDINQIDEMNLMKVINLIKFECLSCKIFLLGYTDDSGEFEYNKALSEKRVKTVQLFLIKNGISPVKIDVDFFGELGIGENNARKVDVFIIRE